MDSQKFRLVWPLKLNSFYRSFSYTYFPSLNCYILDLSHMPSPSRGLSAGSDAGIRRETCLLTGTGSFLEEKRTRHCGVTALLTYCWDMTLLPASSDDTAHFFQENPLCFTTILEHLNLWEDRNSIPLHCRQLIISRSLTGLKIFFITTTPTPTPAALETRTMTSFQNRGIP